MKALRHIRTSALLLKQTWGRTLSPNRSVTGEKGGKALLSPLHEYVSRMKVSCASGNRCCMESPTLDTVLGAWARNDARRPFAA